jgi:V/A-type H+-transporting ATPase subunit F
MEKTIEIAVIGSDDTIQLYNAVGIRAFLVQNPLEAEKTISKLASRQCKIIYVTENLYESLSEAIEKYKFLPFPILIPVPAGGVSQGIGLKKIKENVENAIGIDIF